MSKKQKEDNRDIFDKVLDDYVVPAAGAVVGGALASRVGRSSLNRAKRAAKEADDEFMRASEKESRRPGMLIRSSREFDEAESKTLRRDAEYSAARSRRGRNTVIGAGVGGLAGNEVNKRRK